MMSFTYEYPRPAVTVDAVIFRRPGSEWMVLLIKRGREPFKDNWALPGGFINMDETLEEAVQRELFEETGLEEMELEQLHTFSRVDRDPRHRTISTVFFGIMHEPGMDAKAGDDAAEAGWFPVHSLPELAFDHQEVVQQAIIKLKSQPTSL